MLRKNTTNLYQKHHNKTYEQSKNYQHNLLTTCQAIIISTTRDSITHTILLNTIDLIISEKRLKFSSFFMRGYASIKKLEYHKAVAHSGVLSLFPKGWWGVTRILLLNLIIGIHINIFKSR